ncbi:MAG: MFS transporter [Chlamydiota bacterium]
MHLVSRASCLECFFCLIKKKNSKVLINSISRAKALFSIYFVAAIDNCGYAMVFVLFPPLLLDPQYGFLTSNPTVAEKLLAMGVLYAAFPIAQLIAAPFIGNLADELGRKRVFSLTIFGTMVAYFLTGWVLARKQFFLLFIARLLTGLFSGNQGLCNASIADLSPNAKQRAKNYGILTVVWGISFPLALLLGGFLSDPSLAKSFSPSLPFYIAGAITFLSLVTIAVFFPETYKKQRKKPGKNQGKKTGIDLKKGLAKVYKALKTRETRPFFLLMLIWTLGWGFSITWYGAYVLKTFGVSQEMATIGLMAQGIGWTIGGSIIKPLLLRILPIQAIGQLSYFITAILLLLAATMPTFSSFITVYALSAILGAVSLSSTFNFISLSAPPNMQGKAMGIAQSMISLGFFLVPLLGSLVGALSVNTFYPIAALFLLVGLGIVIKTKKALT